MKWTTEYDGSLVIDGEVVGTPSSLAPGSATPDEARAIVRLMAAAPDLLEACEQAFAHIEDLTDGHCDCNNTPPHCTLCLLRRARDKARGEP